MIVNWKKIAVFNIEREKRRRCYLKRLNYELLMFLQAKTNWDI